MNYYYWPDLECIKSHTDGWMIVRAHDIDKARYIGRHELVKSFVNNTILFEYESDKTDVIYTNHVLWNDLDMSHLDMIEEFRLQVEKDLAVPPIINPDVIVEWGRD